MNSGLYAACTGLMSRMDALDTIANNLANASTTGFRARHNTFHSMLAATGGHELSVLNQDANDYGLLSGTRMDATQGALEKTGNDLDLAIQGPGYFAVQTSSGVQYTRAGNFHVSPQGQLVTAQGDAVLGAQGPVSILGAPVSISGDGTISVNGAVAGKLNLVEFDPAVQMESTGGTYFSAPAGAAKAATQSTMQQGMLESSNVNPMMSTVELIEAQRDVETMRRVLTMFNEQMDKTAAQELPQVS